MATSIVAIQADPIQEPQRGRVRLVVQAERLSNEALGGVLRDLNLKEFRRE